MEVIESSAAVKEMSVEAAVAAVLSEMDGIWALKDEQRTEMQAFLGGKLTLTKVCWTLWPHESITPCTNKPWAVAN